MHMHSVQLQKGHAGITQHALIREHLLLDMRQASEGFLPLIMPEARKVEKGLHTVLSFCYTKQAAVMPVNCPRNIT